MDEKKYYANVIEDYEMGRAKYPKEVFKAIIDYSGLKKGELCLEVGAGPGTATDGFADYELELLEISDEQVDFLKEKYRNNDNVRVYKKEFENYHSSTKYNLIYSATAFHWIDPMVSYDKAADLLSEDGTLAVFWNMPARDSKDEFVIRLKRVLRKYAQGSFSINYDRFVDSQELKWMQYIIRSERYSFPECRRIRWSVDYNAEMFLAWIRSLGKEYNINNFIHWEKCREEIIRCFSEAGGTYSLPQEVLLIMAKKKKDYERISVISAQEMKAQVELSEIAKNPGVVEAFFFNCGENMLYVTDNKKIYGVVNRGDITRMYKNNTPYINKAYIALESLDYEMANLLFEKYPAIYEIPVVDRDGYIKWIVKRNKRKMPLELKNWKTQFSELTGCSNLIYRKNSLVDLFTSLTIDEQIKCLNVLYSDEYLRLFFKDYEVDLM